MALRHPSRRRSCGGSGVYRIRRKEHVVASVPSPVTRARTFESCISAILARRRSADFTPSRHLPFRLNVHAAKPQRIFSSRQRLNHHHWERLARCRIPRHHIYCDKQPHHNRGEHQRIGLADLLLKTPPPLSATARRPNQWSLQEKSLVDVSPGPIAANRQPVLIGLPLT